MSSWICKARNFDERSIDGCVLTSPIVDRCTSWGVAWLDASPNDDSHSGGVSLSFTESLKRGWTNVPSLLTS